MRITKKVEEKYERDALVKIICDLCKKEFSGESWGARGFDVQETEIRYRFGETYPDSSFCEELSFDVCPNCFKKKLIPWFEENGAKATKKDVSW